jgi:hypothetical protein
MNIIIESVCIDDVFNLDGIRYNTNNVYHNGIRPSDYEEVKSQTETSKWIDAFKSYKLITIDLTSPRASWMLEAATMGRHTKLFPHAFDDELETLETHLNQTGCDTIFDGKPYFIRTENVSLKAGQHGVGPYTKLKPVIESLVTCVEGHTPICPETKEIKLYVIPWVELDSEREYRVFVKAGRVTAISQQNLYRVFPVLNHHQADIQTIIEYQNNVLKNCITHIDSYCVDIAILEVNTPYFIEINPFGTEYTSGSSLFGWEQDKDIMYGNMGENTVYFRFTSPTKFDVTDALSEGEGIGNDTD